MRTVPTSDAQFLGLCTIFQLFIIHTDGINRLPGAQVAHKLKSFAAQFLDFSALVQVTHVNVGKHSQSAWSAQIFGFQGFFQCNSESTMVSLSLVNVDKCVMSPNPKA